MVGGVGGYGGGLEVAGQSQQQQPRSWSSCSAACWLDVPLLPLEHTATPGSTSAGAVNGVEAAGAGGKPSLLLLQLLLAVAGKQGLEVWCIQLGKQPQQQAQQQGKGKGQEQQQQGQQVGAVGGSSPMSPRQQQLLQQLQHHYQQQLGPVLTSPTHQLHQQQLQQQGMLGAVSPKQQQQQQQQGSVSPTGYQPQPYFHRHPTSHSVYLQQQQQQQAQGGQLGTNAHKAAAATAAGDSAGSSSSVWCVVGVTCMLSLPWPQQGLEVRVLTEIANKAVAVSPTAATAADAAAAAAGGGAGNGALDSSPARSAVAEAASDAGGGGNNSGTGEQQQQQQQGQQQGVEEGEGGGGEADVLVVQTTLLSLASHRGSAGTSSGGLAGWAGILSPQASGELLVTSGDVWVTWNLSLSSDPEVAGGEWRVGVVGEVVEEVADALALAAAGGDGMGCSRPLSPAESGCSGSSVGYSYSQSSSCSSSPVPGVSSQQQQQQQQGDGGGGGGRKGQRLVAAMSALHVPSAASPSFMTGDTEGQVYFWGVGRRFLGSGGAVAEPGGDAATATAAAAGGMGGDKGGKEKGEQQGMSSAAEGAEDYSGGGGMGVVDAAAEAAAAAAAAAGAGAGFNSSGVGSEVVLVQQSSCSMFGVQMGGIVVAVALCTTAGFAAAATTCGQVRGVDGGQRNSLGVTYAVPACW